MDFQVLGPLRVVANGVDTEVRGVKERTLLMHLVASVGRVVPTADLVDSLWPHDPPRTAAKSLQTYVLRLRNALEPDRDGEPRLLVTAGAGYRLAATERDTDAGRFARLADLARSAAEGKRWQAALDAADEALALWRGPAYPGCEDTSFGPAEARRLGEIRLLVVECRLEALLALGRAGAAVPEIERVITDHPLRERLWELLVLASYRAGRQGDALAAYERVRALLADELGVDPGPALRDLHARVLAQDPGLHLGQPQVHLPEALRRPRGDVVGRDAELAALRDLWARTVAGSTTSALLRGPVGAGASTLASVLAEEVADAGHPVLLGDDPAPPSGPWLRVVEGADASPEPGAMLLRLARPGAEPTEGGTVLDLGPLDADDVRRLVASYAAPDEVEGLAGQVIGGGPAWPGRVHAEAVRLVRETTARRLGAAVDVVEQASARLTAARADVSESIVRLAESDGDTPAEPGVCPWRGLAAYDVGDAPWFAGREHLVAELLSRLASTRALALVGPSGSGKSSALRAGVLAALAGDALPGSSAWRQVVMRPGRHPMRELTRAALGSQGGDVGDLLARLLHAEGQPSRTLVVVDQMEEAWTACGDEGERHAFLDTLAELASDPRSATSVVLALRADYVGEAAEHAGLAALLADGTVLVGSPTSAEVRRAITRPAARARLQLEEGLADTVVSDAGDEPGLLPLLSVALTQVWAQREGDRLTFAAYVDTGGLRGAIATLAEEVWDELDAVEQSAARLLLLRLSGPGEGAGVVRRRVPLAEVEALGPPGLRRVLERLAAARLVSVGDGHVEVAHEALFREWPRLRGWLTDDAAGRAVQRRLALAAAEWDAEGREPTGLWRGTRLQSGLEVAAARPEELTHVETDFLEQGRLALEAEEQAAQLRATAAARQNRRLRWLLLGTAVFLVLALVAGAVALVARGQAQESADDARSSAVSADAKRLAASALNLEYPDLALLAAVEATRLEPGPETYGAVLTLLARQPDVVTRFHTGARFLRGDASPDGTTVYVSENEPVVHAVDAETGEQRWRADLPDMAGEVAASPDGRSLAVSVLGGEGGTTMVLDAATGAERWRFGIDAARALVDDPGPFFLSEVGWLPDGRLVVPTATHLFLADASGRLEVGRRWGRPVEDFQSLLTWPDGRVSTGVGDLGPTVVVDVDRPGAPAVEVPGLVVAVAPDGRSMVQLRGDAERATLRVLDARTFEPRSRAWPIEGFVQEAAFSPDGRQVAVAVDEVVLLRDGRDLAPVRTLTGHSGAVMSVTFAGAEADLVWTSGRDGRAVAFDASGRRGVVAEEPSVDAPHAGSAVPDGPALWTNYDPVRPHRAFLRAPGDSRGRPLPPDGRDCSCQVAATALSPDGSLAVGGYQFFGPDGMEQDRGALRVWDTATRTVRDVVDLPWPVSGVDVTSDGARAVVQGTGGWVVVDLAAGAVRGGPSALPATGPNHDGLGHVEISPDDSRALLVRDDGVRVVDLRAGGTVAGPGPTDVASAAWADAGRRLALGGYDGWFSVVDGDTLEPVVPRRLITGGFVVDVEVSPDGRTAATAGADGDLTLWDVATWQPYGQPVVDFQEWGFVSFSADSATLTADYETGTRVTVAARPEAWVEAACAAANRDLTAEESAVVRPGRTPRPTCG